MTDGPPSESLWERGTAAALQAIADARSRITSAPIEPPFISAEDQAVLDAADAWEREGYPFQYQNLIAAIRARRKEAARG